MSDGQSWVGGLIESDGEKLSERERILVGIRHCRRVIEEYQNKLKLLEAVLRELNAKERRR